VPAGSTVIFSAHGVSRAVRDEAEQRGLKVFDATCPLVTKVHVEVGKMRNQAREVVMIGHKGHPEVEGTMGQSGDGMYLVETPEDARSLKVGTPDKLSFVTQTTLSVDDASLVIAALKEHFPEVQGPKKDDICYATQNRQDAVKSLAGQCDLVIVVGSPNSSNSRRLREVAIARGVAGYLIDGPEEIDPAWLAGRRRIGVTAGASAPEILVKRVVDRISLLTGAEVSQAIGVEEGVSFPLPKELTSPSGLRAEEK
jgi:4-hydroxy-3-methylbut-2-en-1-yl diphosphate reductase